MERVPARSLNEVVARMRALHVETMAARPKRIARGWEGINFDPQIEFNEEAHKESDLLMLDAFELLGQREIVDARREVEESFDGFWYA